MPETLRDLVSAELAEPVDPRVAAMAAAIAAEYPGVARAVLFYGSCLRQAELDGLMLDFYLIVSDYREAYRSRWLRFANRLIPPNVFPFELDGLAAKYAVLSGADFAREMSREARSVSVWARFAQPSRLVWTKGEAARDRVVHAVAEAVPTLFSLTIPTMEGEDRRDPLAVFRAGFALTYDAELRAERKGRSGSIVDSDPDRYARFGETALADFRMPKPSRRTKEQGATSWAEGRERVGIRKRARRAWRWRARKGKALSLIRLAKATTTFAGGVDYIAWKINRHAGTRIVVKPWQRRWPILGALTLLPLLWRRGAIR